MFALVFTSREDAECALADFAALAAISDIVTQPSSPDFAKKRAKQVDLAMSFIELNKSE